MRPRARNDASLVDDNLLSPLASSIANGCFGDRDEAIAELILEELAPNHLMIRYIEAERN